MKRNNAILLLLFVAAISSCTKNTSPSNSTNQSNNSSEVNNTSSIESNKQKYDLEFLNNNLDDYQITFDLFSNELGGEAYQYQVKVIRTKDGYYEKAAENNGSLYIKNGDVYDLYQEDENGVFTKCDGIILTNEELENQIQLHKAYLSIHVNFEDETSFIENEIINGADCVSFYYEADNQHHKYSIEKNTGACIKYDVSENEKPSHFGFVCSEFKTSDIVLPNYQ